MRTGQGKRGFGNCCLMKAAESTQGQADFLQQLWPDFPHFPSLCYRRGAEMQSQDMADDPPESQNG